MADIVVTISTSVLQLTTTPQTVLLSTLYAPGTVFTIRDIAGTATNASPITISTTTGNSFLSGSSSIQITQPYGYVSITPKTSTLWTVNNSFAFPDSQAFAEVRSLTANTIRMSTAVTNSLFASTFNVDSLTTNSLSTLQSMIILGNLSTTSNVQVGGAVNVRNLSVMSDFFTPGSISTVSSVNVGGFLTVRQSAALQSSLNVGGNVVIGGSLSTIGSFTVDGQTTFNSSVLVRGPLTVNADLLCTSTISTSGPLNVINTAVFGGSVQFAQGLSISTSVNIGGSLFVQENLIVGQSTTISSLNVTGLASFSNIVNVFSSLNVTSSLFAGSNVFVNNELIATTISTQTLNVTDTANINRTLTTNSLFVNSNAFVSGATIFGSSLGVGCNLPRYTLDVSGAINASDYFIGGLSLESGVGFSTLVVSSLVVKQQMYMAGALIGSSGTYDTPTLFSSRNDVRNWVSIAMSSNGNFQLAAVSPGFLYTSFDSGNNWTQRATSQNYQEVAVSGSGQYQIATISNATPILSTDYGQSWSAAPGSPQGETCAISSNAQYIITGKGTSLYISSDYGVSFTTLTFSVNTPNFNQVAISATGQFIAAATSKGIYYSSDSGANFISTLTSSNWSKIAMSANGVILTAVDVGNSLLNISINSAGTWTAVDSARAWNSVSLSASGQYQMATVFGGNPFYSSNFGSNWTSTLVAYSWMDVATSSDGTMATIAASNGTLYTKEAIMQIEANTVIAGNLNVQGSLAKASGSFEIPHPIRPNTILVHSFIEGPRADLLYRGKATLRRGEGIVDIEKSCTANNSYMTPGTFVALATNPQIYLQNNDSFDYVKGSISANILFLQSENSNFNGTCDWMVIAERHDEMVKKWHRTDTNGFLILEHPC